MAELTEEAMEIVAKAADEVAVQAEGVAKIARGMNQLKLSYAALGAAIGSAMGATVGFVIAHRKAETKYRLIADAEIEEMRTHFIDKQREIANAPKTVTPELIVKGMRYESEAPEPPEIEVAPGPGEIDNVFDQPEPETWDYHAERQNRTPDKPYIIHRDEFNEGREDHTEVQCTWFDGDDVLADERNNPIDNSDEMVGLVNLDRFGYGSMDPNVLYVRNEALALDIEIVKSFGTYAEEVHGIPPGDEDETLRHSADRWRPSDHDR